MAQNNPEQILNVLQKILEMQKNFVEKLSQKNYIKPIVAIDNSTIGGHTRHMIEFLEIVIIGYEKSYINYDVRERNIELETNPISAVSKIEELIEKTNKKDKLITLCQNFGDENLEISTTYFRELLYNIEHCIHHQALIKVAISVLKISSLVDENFGISPSTMKHRAKINYN